MSMKQKLSVLWHVFQTPGFWGALTAFFGTLMEHETTFTAISPKVWMLVSVVGLLITAFSKAVHTAALEKAVEANQPASTPDPV